MNPQDIESWDLDWTRHEGVQRQVCYENRTQKKNFLAAKLFE